MIAESLAFCALATVVLITFTLKGEQDLEDEDYFGEEDQDGRN